MSLPNRLIREKSPYLLKHAYNPVDWYAWSKEAIEKAEKYGKPIFLSIGYSSCHWCSVMERESFEDDQVARILNDNFVCIKVDREERPDIDEIYMRAVQLMTGQGGWPLNVFLTPDLKPFYGGTYFPPTPRHGLPSFPDLLHSIMKLWKEKKGEVDDNTSQIMRALAESYSQKVSTEPLSVGVLDDAFEILAGQYDSRYGGFGTAPKFPMPSYLFFLLRYYNRTKSELALSMVKNTLQGMARGGIHDQIGGGFHRYSTDKYWLVPHFEKMLYNNSLLAKAYLETYQVTSDPYFAAVAVDTLDWVLSEMTDTRGGFLSAQDADSEGREGAFYVWNIADIKKALGEKLGDVFCKYYGVTSIGNFEGGTNVLFVSREIASLASELGLSTEELSRQVEEARRVLLEIRNRRIRPSTDDKVLTSWNGLAISAMAQASQVLGDSRYLQAASNAAEFILNKMVKDGTLLRRYRDDEASIHGRLEDYSYLVMSLLDLYEASFNNRWLREALRLNEQMIDLFWDDQGNGFFFNQKNDSDIPLNVKDAYDGPTPSGNSVAAMNLLRIAELTGNEDLKRKAELVFQTFWRKVTENPPTYTHMLCGLDFYLSGVRQIVVAGEPSLAQTKDALKEIHSHFIPNKILVLAAGEDEETFKNLVKGKKPINGMTTIYVCENYYCREPVTSVERLRSILSVTSA